MMDKDPELSELLSTALAGGLSQPTLRAIAERVEAVGGPVNQDQATELVQHLVDQCRGPRLNLSSKCQLLPEATSIQKLCISLLRQVMDYGFTGKYPYRIAVATLFKPHFVHDCLHYHGHLSDRDEIMRAVWGNSTYVIEDDPRTLTGGSFWDIVDAHNQSFSVRLSDNLAPVDPPTPISTLQEKTLHCFDKVFNTATVLEKMITWGVEPILITSSFKAAVKFQGSALLMNEVGLVFMGLKNAGKSSLLSEICRKGSPIRDTCMTFIPIRYKHVPKLKLARLILSDYMKYRRDANKLISFVRAQSADDIAEWTLMEVNVESTLREVFRSVQDGNNEYFDFPRLVVGRSYADLNKALLPADPKECLVDDDERVEDTIALWLQRLSDMMRIMGDATVARWSNNHTFESFIADEASLNETPTIECEWLALVDEPEQHNGTLSAYDTAGPEDCKTAPFEQTKRLLTKTGSLLVVVIDQLQLKQQSSKQEREEMSKAIAGLRDRDTRASVHAIVTKMDMAKEFQTRPRKVFTDYDLDDLKKSAASLFERQPEGKTEGGPAEDAISTDLVHCVSAQWAQRGREALEYINTHTIPQDVDELYQDHQAILPLMRDLFGIQWESLQRGLEATTPEKYREMFEKVRRDSNLVPVCRQLLDVTSLMSGAVSLKSALSQMIKETRLYGEMLRARYNGGKKDVKELEKKLEVCENGIKRIETVSTQVKAKINSASEAKILEMVKIMLETAVKNMRVWMNESVAITRRDWEEAKGNNSADTAQPSQPSSSTTAIVVAGQVDSTTQTDGKIRPPTPLDMELVVLQMNDEAEANAFEKMAAEQARVYLEEKLQSHVGDVFEKLSDVLSAIVQPLEEVSSVYLDATSLSEDLLPTSTGSLIDKINKTIEAMSDKPKETVKDTKSVAFTEKWSKFWRFGFRFVDGKSPSKIFQFIKKLLSTGQWKFEKNKVDMRTLVRSYVLDANKFLEENLLQAVKDTTAPFVKEIADYGEGAGKALKKMRDMIEDVLKDKKKSAVEQAQIACALEEGIFAVDSSLDTLCDLLDETNCLIPKHHRGDEKTAARPAPLTSAMKLRLARFEHKNSTPSTSNPSTADEV